MKYSTILFLFSCILLGCRHQQDRDLPPGTSEDIVVQDREKTPAWQQDIQLNEGSLWKANRETTEGILNMYDIVNSSTASTAAEYQALGKALDQEENLLIKRCTMKGPAHDNLHVYLQPLISYIGRLQQINSADEGEELLSLIKEHLEAYNSYFI